MYKYTTDKAYFHDMFWTTVHHLHPWAKELVKDALRERIEGTFNVNNTLNFGKLTFFVGDKEITSEIKSASFNLSDMLKYISPLGIS